MSRRTELILINIFLFVLGAALAVILYLSYSNAPGFEFLHPKTEQKEAANEAAKEAPVKDVYLLLDDTWDVLLGASQEAARERFPAQSEAGRERGIAVLMYHNVYDPADPPYPIDDNYISTVNLEEQLKYLTDNGYEFPSWEQIRKYVAGEIDLPEKSVVLTFDDGAKGFMNNGVPLLEKYNVPATAFIIASRNWREWRRFVRSHPLIELGSHSYDMHKPGGMIGHGGIMTAMNIEDIVADLNRSSRLLGGCKAFAYPFGDYDDYGKCKNAVAASGMLGFTTVYGKVYPDADPCLLPRIRINGSTSLQGFIDSI